MPRTKARISHDEVTRLLKAVTQFGLQIDRISFDGSKLEIVIRNEGDETKGSQDLTEDGYAQPLFEHKL